MSFSYQWSISYGYLESSVKKGKEEAAKLSYILPGDEKVFTRKAQYQFGWDFGPRFVTCGIYKPVSLIIWNDFPNLKRFSKRWQASVWFYMILKIWLNFNGDA